MDYSKNFEIGETSNEEKKYDVTTKWYSPSSVEPRPIPEHGPNSDSESTTDEEEYLVGRAKAAIIRPMPPLYPIPRNGYSKVNINREVDFSYASVHSNMCLSSHLQNKEPIAVSHMPLYFPFVPYSPINEPHWEQPSNEEQGENQAPMQCPHLPALPRLHPAHKIVNVLHTYPADAVQQPSCSAGPSTPVTEDQINPPMWAGYLILKSNYIPVQMNYLYGNPNVGKTALPMNMDGSTEPLKITFRMKMNSNQTIDVQQKMKDENKHCMLLALANGPTSQDILREANKLHRVIVKYLYQKKVAGIISIINLQTGQERYLIHLFPSCDFSIKHLARVAPYLLPQIICIAHLLVVITEK